MAKGKYAKKFNKPITAVVDEPEVSTQEEDNLVDLSDLINNDEITGDDNESEAETTEGDNEDSETASDDKDDSDEHIEVPDEDLGEDTSETESNESIQAQAPQLNTVPALCTYYEGTKLMKVLSVSNNQESLITFAKQILDGIRANQQNMFQLFEDYNEDISINSLETFLVFANTYNMIGGVSDDEVDTKVNELINDGNRVAHHKAKVGNKLQNQLYYSKDLKTLDEVKEENSVQEPELFIENILIV